MPYYVMTCEGPFPIKPIARTPDADMSWASGEPVAFQAAPPLVYALDDDHDGQPLAMYLGAFPVMRDDLVEALTAAGVDNVQYAAAVLEARGVRHDNYKAFNIIGRVACADMDASRVAEPQEPETIEVDFERLVLDESKAHGLLMFRLAENSDAVVVSERVRRSIEERKIAGMAFYGPGEWPS